MGTGPAAVLAWAMVRRGQGSPPADETIVGWLKNRPERLSWACCNRPAESQALGLLVRPIPRVLTDLRHCRLPLDPRSEQAVKMCMVLSGVTAEEVALAFGDRAHLMQVVLQLLEGGDGPG